MNRYYEKEEAKYRKEMERGKLGILMMFGCFAAALVPICFVIGTGKAYNKLREVIKR